MTGCQAPSHLAQGRRRSARSAAAALLLFTRTQREITGKLYHEAQQAVDSPEVRERYAKLGADPFPMTMDRFDAYIRSELASNARLVKAAHITAQ